MPIKRAKHMLQASSEATEIRRRHMDALRRGHSNEIAVKIANGKLPESTPVMAKEEKQIEAPVDEDQTKFDFSKPIEPVKIAPVVVMDTPAKMMNGSVDIQVPRDYQALPWKELQSLAQKISGRSRIASRMEAVAIIQEAQK